MGWNLVQLPHLKSHALPTTTSGRPTAQVSPPDKMNDMNEGSLMFFVTFCDHGEMMGE